MTDIRSYIKDNILLFDGGMGTLTASLIPESIGTACELLNLTHPDKISEIHSSYIKAGSRAIKTNTFGVSRLAFSEDECRRMIKRGFEIANAHSGEAYIFADIGPITVTDAENIEEEYRFIADEFLRCGAENFLFETNSTLDGLASAARYIKSIKPEAYIIVSFASLPDGFTRSGKSVMTLISDADKESSFDCVGLNCASGARHMAKLVSELPSVSKPISVMPNAGYPTVLGNRTFYDSDPLYFARQTASVIGSGARIVGGCCGTTPEHIKALSRAVSEPGLTVGAGKYYSIKRETVKNEFYEALCDGSRRPFAVELDPPDDADIEKFMSGAAELKSGGASVITIADCPIARARMDSSILACKVKRELNIGVLPHMTCRDRNLNAIKALLLGLCAEGVHNVLTVTGDPIPSAERTEVKSVYNFNSRMLAEYITELGKSSLTTPFHIFGALNVNAHNFDMQLKLAKEKEAHGICGFLTQPILTESAYGNLKRARAELKGKILGGIFPLVSHRNACFMNSEVSGVKVDERIIALYENKSREQGEELALKISCDIAERIKPYVDGYYLMTPFSRTSLVKRIMESINIRK